MIRADISERYLEALLSGNRKNCRAVIEETLQNGIPANSVYINLIWPIMIQIEKLHKDDRITSVQEHLATRINRNIVDQLQNKLPRKGYKNKKIVVACAPDEKQELGAQIMADMFESNGWDVRFLGGGLTNDDILSFVNEWGPDILLVYGTIPSQAPDIRKLIDTIKSVNAWPDMRVMVSGGLFNRAEGLWIEIGADLFAPDAPQALEIASTEEHECPQPQRTINRRKKRHSAEKPELQSVN